MNPSRRGVTVLLGVVAAVAGCKQGASSSAASASGSGSAGSGRIAIAVVGADAAMAPVIPTVAIDAGVAAGLVFETNTDGKDPFLLYAFDKHVPRLPAVSADGKLLADFASDATGPMMPVPATLAIKPVDADGPIEQLELVDDAMAAAAGSDSRDWLTDAPDAPVLAVLHDRGRKALARLHKGGFASLVPIDVAKNANGERLPTKIGDLTLTPTGGDGADLEVTLTDAHGKTLHHQKIASYTHGTYVSVDPKTPCEYSPMFVDALTDAARAHLYLDFTFRHTEECDQAPVRSIVWDLALAPVAVATAGGGDAAAIAAIVDKQFDGQGNGLAPVFTPDAQVPTAAGLGTPDAPAIHFVSAHELYAGHEDHDVQIALARDGNTAWVSLTTKITVLPQNEKSRDDDWRASDVLVKTAAGWKIAAMTWTWPQPNAKVNADAKAGTLHGGGAFTAPGGDASLLAAFAKLTTDGVDATAAARADLVAIGSGPGERTVGGAAFAGGWNAAWKGHVAIVGSVAKLAPSGTTGWIAANVLLAKPAYKIPFFVFCVFDKTAAGEWTLVHIHFSV